MSRPLRIEYQKAFYHIVQRGIEKKEIFKTDRDKEKFLSYLEQSFDRYHSICHTYDLMDNHYHMIIETPKANISKIMHYLNTSYAVYYNIKHKRVGPLYQGRYKAILVEEDEYLHHLSRYIHLNPVRAKMVKDPIEYKWSSYKYFIGKEKRPKWLEIEFILTNFGNSRSKAQKEYKRFVGEGIGMEDEKIKEGMYKGIILGGKEFIKEITERFVEGKEDKAIPAIRDMQREREMDREGIEKIVRTKIEGEKEIRKITIYLLRKYTQMKLREIAESYENMTYTGVSVLYKRVEERRKRDKRFNGIVRELEKMSNVKP
jgi:putative transposase